MRIDSKKFLQIGFGGQDPDRLLAGLFHVKGKGYVFLEVGWVNASLNPVHIIGDLVKEGKNEWVFEQVHENGKTITAKITTIKESDRLYAEAVKCFEYSEKHGWQGSEEEAIKGDFWKHKVEKVWVHER